MIRFSHGAYLFAAFRSPPRENRASTAEGRSALQSHVNVPQPSGDMGRATGPVCASMNALQAPDSSNRAVATALSAASGEAAAADAVAAKLGAPLHTDVPTCTGKLLVTTISACRLGRRKLLVLTEQLLLPSCIAAFPRHGSIEVALIEQCIQQAMQDLRWHAKMKLHVHS